MNNSDGKASLSAAPAKSGPLDFPSEKSNIISYGNKSAERRVSSSGSVY